MQDIGHRSRLLEPRDHHQGISFLLFLSWIHELTLAPFDHTVEAVGQLVLGNDAPVFLPKTYMKK
jgi:hypothetical protein